MATNTTFAFLAPNPFQEFDTRGSSAIYTADAFGLIKGVPLSACRDLSNAGCRSLGPDAGINSSAAWNAGLAVPQVLAAAGLTQGAAGAITSNRVRATCTTSSEGVILKAVATSAVTEVYIPGTKGVKVYPPLNGTIDALSTNTALLIVAAKGILFTQRDATHFDSFKSA